MHGAHCLEAQLLPPACSYQHPAAAVHEACVPMAQMSMEGFVPRVLFRGIEAGCGRAGRDGLRVRVCRSVWEGAAPAVSVRVESAR